MSATSMRRLYLGLLFFGLLAPIVVMEIERSRAEALLVILTWLAWTLLPILFVLASVTSGFIEVRGWKTYRAKEPARFWVGLVTMSALLATFAGLATMGLSAYFGV